MSSSNGNHLDDMDKKLTDEAWEKFQLKLANEPVQTKWLTWPVQASYQDGQTEDSLQTATNLADPAADTSAVSASAGLLEPKQGNDRKQQGSLIPAWLHKRRKWVGAAAACFLFAAIVATPTGNKALASILNKFRVHDLTVIKEQDIRNLYNQVTSDGVTREQMNKFGTFTQTSGTVEGRFEPAEAEKILGRKLVIPPDFKPGKDQVHISPSNKLTFEIKANEVNNTIKRLGGKKLLPASIDGKTITLDLKETVQYELGSDDKKLWASFSQLAVPVLTVDSSVPVSEALEAVLDFPLLPSHLKQALKNSRILENGSIPLPVVAQDTAEQVSINGTKVILNDIKMNDQTRYSAIWVRDGQLFMFEGGNRYTEKTVILDKIKELIGS